MTTDILIEAIDEVLPQTQCGLCGYGGCHPYAEAIVTQHELINKCPPGGVSTLQKLAALTQQDSSPYLNEMHLKAKPPSLAIIREAECIGCTKCIQACPVDAIIGSAKQMHTVIADECTGCELCLEPCPVDCIDLVLVAARSEQEQKEKSSLARKRFVARNVRLQKITQSESPLPTSDQVKQETRKSALQDAMARIKAKKADQ